MDNSNYASNGLVLLGAFVVYIKFYTNFVHSASETIPPVYSNSPSQTVHILVILEAALGEILNVQDVLLQIIKLFAVARPLAS